MSDVNLNVHNCGIRYDGFAPDGCPDPGAHRRRPLDWAPPDDPRLRLGADSNHPAGDTGSPGPATGRVFSDNLELSMRDSLIAQGYTEFRVRVVVETPDGKEFYWWRLPQTVTWDDTVDIRMTIGVRIA